MSPSAPPDPADPRAQPHESSHCRLLAIADTKESATMSIVLHQFPSSHYNDKARWGLAWKGIAHQKKSYLPGLHVKSMQRLSGQTQTLVLDLGGEVVAGSGAILALLEERFPEKPLLPADTALRSEALAVQKRFDDEVGPAVRAAAFSVLFDYPAYVAQVFGRPQPALKRFVYRMMLPKAKGRVQKAYRTLDKEYIQRCIDTVNAALDEVVERTAETGHMVGGTFTIADLTAAALLAPAVNPDHPDMKRPEPQPEAALELTRGWREHQGAQWVYRMYSHFR